MPAQTVKVFAETFGFSDEAVSAILSHLNEYAETNDLTVLKKTKQVVTFSYENKIRCKFGSVETANEQIVFIPGDGYVSTIVVAMKDLRTEDQTTQHNQEPIMNEEQKKNIQDLLDKCEAMDAEIKTPTHEETKAAANGLLTALAKTATYLSAATAIGIIGYYAWKKFGNSAE